MQNQQPKTLLESLADIRDQAHRAAQSKHPTPNPFEQGELNGASRQLFGVQFVRAKIRAGGLG